MTLSEREKMIWLAALIDGEGSFVFREHGKGWRSVVSISNTDFRLMNELKRQIKCGQVYTHVRSNAADTHRKTAYTWRLNTTQQRVILPQLLPFFVLKHEQCKIIIHFLNISAANRPQKGRSPVDMHNTYRKIRQEIQYLNRKGPK